MVCFTLNGFVVLKKPHGVYEVSFPQNQARRHATARPSSAGGGLAAAHLSCSKLDIGQFGEMGNSWHGLL